MMDFFKDVAKDIKRDYGDRSITSMCFFGLAEEAGEVLGIAKRRNRMRGLADLDRSTHDCLVSELGDVLWYIAAIAHDQGISFDEIWEENRRKINGRYGK